MKVCGTADINMEIGEHAFTVNCIVINDTDIDFPADASIIIGVNFLANNELDISISKWALMKQGDVIKILNLQGLMEGCLVQKNGII